jgi:hypothetical protein
MFTLGIQNCLWLSVYGERRRGCGYMELGAGFRLVVASGAKHLASGLAQRYSNSVYHGGGFL